MTVFAPTAEYASAVVSVGPPPRVNNLLNFTKNRLTLLPVIALTWLDPKIGLEVSGAVSLETSFKDKTTDWQTAPLLNVETAVVQHLPQGFSLGMAGYYSRQLGEDSGTGAEAFKAEVGARGLQAKVFGVGPLITYQTKFGGTTTTFKLKYTREFGARRRFENEVISASIGVSF